VAAGAAAPRPAGAGPGGGHRGLVKGGLEGALSWTQVYHAMHLIEDEASARRLDRVERIYDALRPADEDQEAEPADRPTVPLSEEQRVELEGLTEANWRMSMELREAQEARELGLEIGVGTHRHEGRSRSRCPPHSFLEVEAPRPPEMLAVTAPKGRLAS
jgi:hypothetical protein